jgi:hypothetical protein
MNRPAAVDHQPPVRDRQTGTSMEMTQPISWRLLPAAESRSANSQLKDRKVPPSGRHEWNRTSMEGWA